MLLQTVLGFLLACAVSLSSSAVVLENGMPILWNQLGDLYQQNGVLTPNPWQFLDRMGLYRLMIDATNPFMGPMGTGANENPMFGLPLQLAWLLTSGRLADPTGTTTCGVETGHQKMCISTESWWACENYFVSVLPFLSAVQNGFMRDGVQVQMQTADGVTEYCTTYANCSARYSDVMAKWDAFFKELKGSSAPTASENEKKDTILGLYWAAHMASTSASSTCDAKKRHLSGPEESFANSWLNAAEYVAAAHFHFNLELASKFIEPLPGQVLKEGDVAPNIDGLSTVENQMLVTLYRFEYINKILGGRLLNFWRNAMCSMSTRERGRALLERLLLTTNFNFTIFISFTSRMFTEC